MKLRRRDVTAIKRRLEDAHENLDVIEDTLGYSSMEETAREVVKGPLSNLMDIREDLKDIAAILNDIAAILNDEE